MSLVLISISFTIVILNKNHAVERLWVEVNCRTNYPIKRALVQMENDGVIDMEDEVTKFCVSWVAKKVVEVGLSYVVNSWNSHPIPGNESYCKKNL